MRQQGSRYAIRAGRNLPDKEFRYLRMVIVTTAVYWGFNYPPHTPPGACSRVLLTFQHRAGVSPYTSTCNVFARTCVFNKQSLPSLLCGHTQRTPHKGDCRTWPPFSRSYGGILPSSLTIVHPNALVSSTRPPVSVSGTGRAHTSLEAFLDSTGTSNIPNNLGTHHASPLYAERIYLSYGPHAYTTIQ